MESKLVAKQQQQSAAASTTMNAVLSKVTQIQEGIVEQEIDKYDSIIRNNNNDNSTASNNNNNNENDFIQQWRMKRIQEYEMKQKDIQKYHTIDGHGMYQELGEGGSNNNTIDIAKEFFNIMKVSQRVIIHFYRPTTELCNTFHTHLHTLASRHIETRFLKCNVQDYDDTNSSSSSSNSTISSTSNTTNFGKRGHNDNIGLRYLIIQLQIRIMPTILCIENQQIIHRLEGCNNELQNRINFTTNHLAYILGHKYHMIYPTINEIADDINTDNNTINPRSNNTKSTSSYITGGTKGYTRHRYRNEDEDEDF